MNLTDSDRYPAKPDRYTGTGVLRFGRIRREGEPCMHAPWRGSPCRHQCHVVGEDRSHSHRWSMDPHAARCPCMHAPPLLVFSDQLLITQKCISISVSEFLQTAAARPLQSSICFRFFYGQRCFSLLPSTFLSEQYISVSTCMW